MLVAPAKFEKQMCKNCDEYVHMSFEHILFTCRGNEIKRHALWEKVIQACPKQLAGELNTMSITRKTNMLLNGLNNSFVYEWGELFKCIADYLYLLSIGYKK